MAVQVLHQPDQPVDDRLRGGIVDDGCYIIAENSLTSEVSRASGRRILRTYLNHRGRVVVFEADDSISLARDYSEQWQRASGFAAGARHEYYQLSICTHIRTEHHIVRIVKAAN